MASHLCPCRGEVDLGCCQAWSDLCSHTSLMENLTDGTAPMTWSQQTLHTHLQLVWWIDCPSLFCCTVIHSSVCSFFLITGSIVTRQKCVWTVNDLLCMLYELFSGYFSVVCDVGVRSIVSYSVSSSFLFADLSLPLCSIHPEYSHQQIDSSTAHPLFLFSRERNVRKHSKPGTVPVVSEKEKHVVTVVK